MNAADETNQIELQHENVLKLIHQEKSFLVVDNVVPKDSKGRDKISKYYQILEFCDGRELKDLIDEYRLNG